MSESSFNLQAALPPVLEVFDLHIHEELILLSLLQEWLASVAKASLMSRGAAHRKGVSVTGVLPGFAAPPASPSPNRGHFQ